MKKDVSNKKPAAAFTTTIAFMFVIVVILLFVMIQNDPAAPTNIVLPSAAASEVKTPFVTPFDPDGLTVPDDGSVRTVVWVSDTQHYADKFPEIYDRVFRFLSENRMRLGIEYIVHTGDLVQNSLDENEWQTAQSAFSLIDGIPYGVLAGNHDIGGSELDFSNYYKYFGDDCMRRRTYKSNYFGSSYSYNRCHYDLIDIGSLSFVFVYVSYSPDSACVSWANSVFERCSERIGVLCTHDYFNADLSLSSSGKYLFDDVVSANANIRMVMCGHNYNVNCVEATIDGSRTVYQMISNYQAAGQEGGSGYMQFLQVDEAKREIRVLSYSPYMNDRRYHDEPSAISDPYHLGTEKEEYIISFSDLLKH